jgi:alpha-beta hydrolase superfamily lysophospholipase
MNDVINVVDGRVQTVGRIELYFRGWEAPLARASLLVVHGLSEHSGRYEEFGHALAESGINVYALDLRGHGASEGRRGHVERFDHYLQDLDRFRSEIQGTTESDLPLFVLGHSMGGLIVARYIEEYESPFQGAIITSPWLATAMAVPRWKAMAASFLNKFLPSLPIDADVDDRYLSHDPLIITRYREDPLVHGKITPRLFAEASQAMGLVMQRSERIRIPVLLLLAGDDRIVDTRKSEAFARSLTAPDVTIRVLPEYYHEVLNDYDRETVFKEIHDWILRHE